MDSRAQTPEFRWRHQSIACDKGYATYYSDSLISLCRDSARIPTRVTLGAESVIVSIGISRITIMKFSPTFALSRIVLSLVLPGLLATVSLIPIASAQVATPPPVSGRPLSDPEGILPADVLARVTLLRANVDLLRRYMGRNAPPPPLLQGTDARPGEVYSQASTWNCALTDWCSNKSACFVVKPWPCLAKPGRPMFSRQRTQR